MGYGYGEMCSEGMSATRRIYATCECQTSSTMALLMSLYHVVS